MATLRIEGGRRLSGTVAVEGNKNSALPLIAACLLTDEECVISNVPRIRDVEVLLEIIAGPWRDGAGCGHVDAPDQVRVDHHRAARSGARRQAARLRAAARAAAGAARRRPPGASRRRFPGPAHHQHAPAGAHGARRRAGRRARARARRAGRADGRVVLPGRGVGHGHGDGAPGRGRRARPDRDPPRGDGAARRRALPVPARDGRARSRASARRRFAWRAPARCKGATHRLQGDYIEAGSWGVVAAITGGEITVNGARAEDMEVIAAPLRQMGLACHVRRRALLGRAVDADRRPAGSRPASGRDFPATWSASSPSSRRRPTAARWCTTGSTSCASSRSSS